MMNSMKKKNRILAALILAGIGLVSGTQGNAQSVMSLAGKWTVRLDEQKTGEQAEWYKKTFERPIQLPGTLDDAGIGSPPAPVTGVTKEVMTHLARKHAYIGYAW